MDVDTGVPREENELATRSTQQEVLGTIDDDDEDDELMHAEHEVGAHEDSDDSWGDSDDE